MSTINTTNRNYVFPLKDEDLEASNTLLNASFDMIDLDVHNLFTNKANSVDVDLSTTVDSKISSAIQAIDTYGTYIAGDVHTDPTDNTKLILENVMSTPGTYTKITVNAKGQVTFGDSISTSDLTDYSGGDYVLKTDIDDANTAVDKVWSSSKIDTLVNGYVTLTSYTDADVLSKVKNVASTISGYGITDSYTKSEVNNLVSTSEQGIKFSVANIAERDALTAEQNDLCVVQSDRKVYRNEAAVWVFFFDLDGVHTHEFSSLTTLPTTLSGYGITDALLTTDGASGTFVDNGGNTITVVNGQITSLT